MTWCLVRLFLLLLLSTHIYRGSLSHSDVWFSWGSSDKRLQNAIFTGNNFASLWLVLCRRKLSLKAQRTTDHTHVGTVLVCLFDNVTLCSWNWFTNVGLSGSVFIRLLLQVIKEDAKATPLFLFTYGGQLTKLLKISTKKYLITKRNS